MPSTSESTRLNGDPVEYNLSKRKMQNHFYWKYDTKMF